MDRLVTAMDLDEHLDVFGQQPGLNIYTQICLCFSVADSSSYPQIIEALMSGLERLSINFPWVAGQVVNEGSGGGNSGVFKIKTLGRVPRLIVKDLRNEPSMPTMDALRQAKFPFNMLDENIIAPCNTFPQNSVWPVFFIQASFVTGGLLLTFNGNHQAVDMTGQGQIIDLLAKACGNEPFTTGELSSGNPDRRNIIPLLDDSYEQGSEIGHQLVKPTPSPPVTNEATSSAPECTWAYFSFPRQSLIALKSLATETVSSRYISTDDALTAFVWQCIIRARLPRYDDTTETTLARAVDPRRYIGLPSTYPGLVQNMVYHKYTLRQLVQEPLGIVAAQLRAAVNPETSRLGYDTRALATVLSRAPDKGIVSVTACLDLSKDIMLSSWVNMDFYALDFGLGLGRPEAVRRPQFPPVESLIYCLPKRLDGGIMVGMCLRHEDMQRLRANSEFVKYTTYIG